VTSLIAIAIGASLPLAALWVVARWRSKRTSAFVRRPRAEVPVQAVAAPDTPHDGLIWLRDTIGRARVSSAAAKPASTLRTCEFCGRADDGSALFCRRCGRRFPAA